jgi:protein-L-isoaspartate O-methyltransferase
MEIGTGSGTQTGIWAQHSGEVHSIELSPFKFAGNLGEQVYLRSGDGAYRKRLPSM